MENRSSKPDQGMNIAYALLGTLGIKMTYDDFLDFCYMAFNTVRPLCFTSKLCCVVDADGLCDLLVDMKYIKAVSTIENTFEQWRTLQTLNSEDGISVTDEFEDSKVDFSNPQDKVLGEYVDFEVIDKSTIQVTQALSGRNVYILCQAPLLDSDNLPLLTNKQVEALTYQVAVLHVQKQMFMGCVTPGLDLNYLVKTASRKVAQSRVPDMVTDNEWDEVLNIRTSFGRKVFNKDFKFKK